MSILEPLGYHASMPARDAASDFTQRVAIHVDGFTAEQPAAYWLWHPIPNDPFLAIAQRQRPDLLTSTVAELPDDEAAALALEALCLKWTACGIAGLQTSERECPCPRPASGPGRTRGLSA